MTTIFQREMPEGTILPASREQAMALGDPIRATIADLLALKPMSIEDMLRELRKKGVRKAPTTIRHHVDILKEAGVIELCKVDEVQGGVLKYYASRLKLRGHEGPETAYRDLTGAVEETSKELKQILRHLMKTHKEEILKAVRSLKPCPHCRPEHFFENVIVELFQRAVSRSVQSKEFKALVREMGIPKQS